MHHSPHRIQPDPSPWPWWTDSAVLRAAPGWGAGGALHSLPQVRTDAGREALLSYFHNGWALTELLFAGLADEQAFFRRPPHKLRHPLIFYFGHPIALYVNKLRLAGLLNGPVNARFEKLFETGVDEMRWDDLYEGEDVWPSLQQVCDYRRTVYSLIRRLIETHPALGAPWPDDPRESPLWALVMGFEHERIHLETSSVLMRELPPECVRKPHGWPEYLAAARETPPENRLLPVPARRVSLGKPAAVQTFGWDNEYGAETREVPAFHATECLISNREFHAFVAAGGYADERWWSAEGWAWRRFRNAKWPAFWAPSGPAGLHEYRLRTCFEVLEMQWSWPVCVNFHEAKAYAAWRGAKDNAAYRLPAEAEHRALRAAPQEEGNLSLRHGAECSVRAFPANADGFHDASGNVWQWCEDHFHPLPGFAPHPLYDDFSTPCYDGEHQMILGGSFISTGDEASVYARFHFRPHFFQHAGFRLVRAETSNAKTLRPSAAAPYEARDMVDKYLLMHWGAEHEIHDAEKKPLPLEGGESGRGCALREKTELEASPLPAPAVRHLPLRCAELALRFAEGRETALDLGCAVGRAAFELARHFRAVTGVDYSREFIHAAETLRERGALDYSRKDEGNRSTRLTACVDPGIDRARLRFETGDACALSPRLQHFDAVLLANVLCRLPDPAACLARMPSLVKPGGVLVMTTPFSWLEEYTPQSRWLHGLEEIRPLLPGFALLHIEEIPFLIREHRRKFEYIVTQATVWRRA